MRLFCYKYRFTIPRRKKTTTKEQKQQQKQATNGNDTLTEYFQETTEKPAKTLKCFLIR